jgi:predicted RNA-binding Zn ribbon-like protein
VASAQLLTGDSKRLLRRCAGAEQGCAWLFVDHSRGARRRWCSMEVCGNRAKARAHYSRAQAG